MIWPAIRAAIYVSLGAAEVAVDVYDRGSKLVRRLLPRKREDAHPLPHRDVERIAEFGRRAGHESEPRR